ncbi:MULTISPECIES: hypothetical protein [unclassified Streptomyces]|uniref:hypothetical protein n=1 Tax=unclassified Streptomyces TaxID=2593676 RepID=UPI000DAEE0C0|nr:hypothetical protein DNK55_30285 [Streptomyces sp. AC1-42T]PZT80918.1 hypothetical protein DNK56_01285 [Streptomyces sp. AC1-42W]
MASHASAQARGRHASPRNRPGTTRHHPVMSWAVPATLGLILGCYATAIVRGGGVLTGTRLALGLVSGAVLAVLCFGLGRIQDRLPRELRAAAYGVLTGGSIGFLYSLSGASILAASMLGVFLGIGGLLTAYYYFYTHE